MKSTSSEREGPGYCWGQSCLAWMEHGSREWGGKHQGLGWGCCIHGDSWGESLIAVLSLSHLESDHQNLSSPTFCCSPDPKRQPPYAQPGIPGLSNSFSTASAHVEVSGPSRRVTCGKSHLEPCGWPKLQPLQGRGMAKVRVFSKAQNYFCPGT